MNARRIINISIWSALMIVSSMIILPIGPVPTSLQTMFVALIAIFLKLGDAALCMVINLFLKLILTGGQTLFTPSFGFLIGFIFAAYIGSAYFEKNHRKNLNKSIAIGIGLSMAIPYIFGLAYMAWYLNVISNLAYSIGQILMTGFVVFIPGDIIKATLAYGISRSLEKEITSKTRV